MDGNVKLILTNGGLPDIMEPVVIDGYSQDDAHPNTNPSPQPMNGKLLIDINAQGGTGRIIYSATSGSTIKGLILRNLDGRTVNFEGPNSSNNKLQGCYVNLEADGLTPDQTTYEAVDINAGAHDNLIGGTNPEDRNIITNSLGSAVVITEYHDTSPMFSDNNIIQGNVIGVGKDLTTSTGLTDAPIRINGEGNVIGGNTPEAGNYISGSPNHGIVVGQSVDTQIESNIIINNNSAGIYSDSDEGLVIKENKIGVLADGVTAAGNGQSGIYINNSVSALVGGVSLQDSNVISHNTQSGVAVNGSVGRSTIIGNSIVDNGGLGIDIYNNGVTPNDPLDTDTGPNDVLNFPIINNVTDNGTDTQVTYNVDLPAGDYRIELFANTARDPSGYGQGESRVGTQNITSTGSGAQTFSATVSGVGYENIAGTATLIDGSAPSGFGATSEFGNFDLQQGETDVELTKTLTNPQDISAGATLHYDFNYTNNGPDSLDLTQFNDAFSGTGFTIDFVAPDITPTDLSGSGPFPGTYYLNNVYNPDLQCAWLPHTAAPFFGAYDHADWGAVACSYIGSGSLNSGESLDYGIDFEVSNSSELSFKNYALAFAPVDSVDPDAQAIQDIYDSGDDVINGFIDSGNINNFATAQNQGPADIGVSGSFVSPGNVAPGADVYFDFTLTNRGPSALDLADVKNPNSGGLGSVLFPANELSYVASVTPNIACFSAGPGSNLYLGNAAIDHPNHEILTCVYSGSAYSELLSPGESLTIRLRFTANPSVSNTFTLYGLSISIQSDPDAPQLYNDIFSASGDILDTISNDNFARVVYVSAGGDSSNNGESNNQGSANNGAGTLGETGQNIDLYIIASIALVMVSLFAGAKFAHSKKQNLV